MSLEEAIDYLENRFIETDNEDIKRHLKNKISILQQASQIIFYINHY